MDMTSFVSVVLFGRSRGPAILQSLGVVRPDLVQFQSLVSNLNLCEVLATKQRVESRPT